MKQPRVPAELARRLTAILAVTSVVLGGVILGLQIAKPGDDPLAETRSDAMTIGRARIPKMLSYSYTSIDADVKTAVAQTTGEFKSEFEALMEDQVREGAVAGRISTKAEVVEIATVSASESRVKLLAFINLTTTSGERATPQLNGSRVEVTMVRSGNRWLVSDLKPV